MRRAFLFCRPRPSVMILMVLIAVLALSPACKTNDPTAPTAPVDLTGNTPNVAGTFSGLISVTGGGIGSADGLTDLIINVRVRDDNGNPVANGTPVNVSIDIGTIRLFGADPATAASSVRAGTFEGNASFAVRSTVTGSGTVTAWIADVATVLRVTFDRVPLEALVDLIFRGGGGDTISVRGVAPTDFTLVGKVKTVDGLAIAGVEVEFHIIEDLTIGSGHGAAFFGSPSRSLTDSAGEAFATILLQGEGTVTLTADVLDPVDGSVIFRSNQVTAIATATQENTAVTLAFDDGTTSTTGAPNVGEGMTATVTDLDSGTVLSGRLVRWTIVEYSTKDVALRATFSDSTPGSTSTLGMAFNTLFGHEPDAIIVVEAELLDDVTSAVQAISNQITLQITGGAPVASFTYTPDNPAVDQVVSFRASTSLDVGGSIVEYRWDWGDGTSADIERDASAHHRFSAAGTFTVTLTVTDNFGEIGTTTLAVTVIGGAPIASFVYSPDNPSAGQVVSFDASSSLDPGATLQEARWDWGDGTSPTLEADLFAEHVFSTAGTYTVTLTIRDNFGATDTATLTVTVS